MEESHNLTERVEEDLIGFDNICHVHIHVEPSNFSTIEHSMPANWES
ncbi:hypothetical protein [Thermoactinomyces mirandus]|uniref:Uncharacterized protein n=1 Tax=Thermoactinomyces mirandus TaxID=2756294 RepID=A0A7W2ATB5_9BACL|nr:hypothetical protein [Thermoactinomyces mirandus]MBA4603575.1 hypothetical protein [Thermoactinomyces mirandus]